MLQSTESCCLAHLLYHVVILIQLRNERPLPIAQAMRVGSASVGANGRAAMGS